MIKQTDLIWCTYADNNTVKNFLLVYLGQHNDNIVALDSDKIPNNEIAKIRGNIASLRTQDLRLIGTWIKENLPVSYQTAYRHFKTKRLNIIRTYGISELKPTQ